MQYLAQREHVLKSLNVLLSYLHSLSYLLFPSFGLFAARWVIQYAWLALQKEVVRHQLRWGVIPLSMLTISLCIHCFTIPGAPIILDFIGQQTPHSLIIVLLLDFVIACLEFLVAAIFYEHVIAYANIINGKDPRFHHAISSVKPRTIRRGTIVLDMPLSLIIKLLFNPRSLLAASASPRRRATPEASQNGETDALSSSDTSTRPTGLPLPFNLGSAVSNRVRTVENPIPGALLRDW